MLNANGAFTGTPTTTGTFNFTARVTAGASATKPFTITVTAASSTQTIFSSTAVPTVVDGGDTSAVQLGVKFRATSNGTISGIRFYKAGPNTGTHVGSLWSSTGTLLRSAQFTNETASGWQQVDFAPVAITAGTVYVASYHTPSGRYSINTNYFAGANGVNNGALTLHALGNTETGGPNGVYRYGASNSLP